MQKVYLRYLLVSILLIFTFLSYSQKYVVHKYYESDGLASSIVYDITQDSTGRLWFATDKGITVYDGLNWKSYNQLDGLVKERYAKLFVDEKGNLWAIPSNSTVCISKFNGKQWELKYPMNRDNVVHAFSNILVFYDKNDSINILLGTKKEGLFYYHHGGWTPYNKHNDLQTNMVNAIDRINDSIFIATDKGLAIFANNRFNW